MTTENRSTKKKSAAALIRDRVKELVRVKASDLIPHEGNPRDHDGEQRETLNALLDEIGFAGALLARRTEKGKLVLIDGHMRAQEMGEQEVPVLILDVDAKEATKLLLSLDPIGAMATTNKAAYRAALEEVETGNEVLDKLWQEIAGEEEEGKLEAPEDREASRHDVGAPRHPDRALRRDRGGGREHDGDPRPRSGDHVERRRQEEGRSMTRRTKQQIAETCEKYVRQTATLAEAQNLAWNREGFRAGPSAWLEAWLKLRLEADAKKSGA